jgi:hypothetical protein
MSCAHDFSCGCPQPAHPPPPLIPAGLSELRLRQAAGFPEYRAAMLATIPLLPPLQDWRARSATDLGLMLVEAWSYVLDVTGFYDARSAERSYLSTAPDALSAQRLIGLIGHRPRPAMAARVQLAVEADGHDPVTLPAGTSFRSGPFAGEPPQVFELVQAHTIWPQRNRWRLAPVREDRFDGVLRFLPRRAPNAGAVLLLRTASQAAAVRVLAMEAETADDGETYQRAVLDPSSQSLSELIDQPLSSLQVAILRLPLARSALGTANGAAAGSMTLDGLYPQLRAGTWAALELSSGLHAVRLQAVSHGSIALATGTSGGESATAQVPATVLSFDPPLSLGSHSLVHVAPLEIGAPTRPAKTALMLKDLQPRAALKAPIAPLGAAPASGTAIVVGAQQQGALLHAQILQLGAGAAELQPDASSLAFAQALNTPVNVFGNVVEAVRGESVRDEILGAGDASRSQLSFKLKKKPLTWVEDASRASGRRPELTVRVDGQAWSYVETLYGHTPQERVFTLRQDVDNNSWVEFGFGRGALPGTGVDNVRADYRFGAGAAKPPPGSISQIAVPIRGLGSVRAPLAASGGADAEHADELRSGATASALTLGRAVSLADFEALARGYAGVLNASAAWAWDERRQRACVKLWVITDGGDPSTALRGWLSARAVPDLQIAVERAQPAAVSSLSIALQIDARFEPADVRLRARTALFDAPQALLSPKHQRIGAALFRSALSHALHQVAGVAGVNAILFDGLPMPQALAPGQGRWFDLAAGTTVN